MTPTIDLGYYDKYDEPEPLEFATLPVTTFKTVRGEDGKPQRVPDQNVYQCERSDVVEEDDYFNPEKKSYRVTWSTVNQVTVDGRSFTGKISDNIRHSGPPGETNTRIEEEVGMDSAIPESEKAAKIKSRKTGAQLDATKTRSLGRAVNGDPGFVCDPNSGRIVVAVAVRYDKKDAEKRWPRAMRYFPADEATC